MWGDDTYFIKDVLKKLGFRWDPNNKRWYIRASKEEATEKAKELEKYAKLHWIGKPLIKRESVLDSIISKLTQDKVYVVYDKNREIIDDAVDKGWKEILVIAFYDVFASPDRKYYILDDDVINKTYVIRDDEGKIEKFMKAIDSFIYDKVPKELGIENIVIEPKQLGPEKLPAISKVKLDLFKYRIEYHDIDFNKNDLLTLTLKFDNFEKGVAIRIEKKTEVISETLELTETRYIAYIEMKEISELIYGFIAGNYKDIFSLSKEKDL